MHKYKKDFYNIIDKISTALIRRDKKTALFPLRQEKSCLNYLSLDICIIDTFNICII